jgi:hypothetical protein
LKACGFKEEHNTKPTGKDTQWDDTFNNLEEIAPVHSWEPLLAALHSAEVEEWTADATRLHCDKIKEIKEDSANPKRH